MLETWVRSLGWEDPLEEGMATHSGILAWRICMDRGAWRATVHRVTKSRTLLSDYAATAERAGQHEVPLVLELLPQTFVSAALVAQTVKNLPAMQETWVRFLGWEDPLEEGMATHSSILAWRICINRGNWQAMVHGVTKSWT